MPTRSALDLADLLAKEASAGPTRGELRAQAAFVRALVDEVERTHPSDRVVVAIREQLGDELQRLAQLIEADSAGGVTAEPDPVVDVLIVDDDPDTLRTHKAVVSHLGYPCRTARDGEEAMREHEKARAAIVLSDWRMPGMSGLDLCRALKAQDPDVYVILVTGYEENAVLLDGVRGGADDFLRKPVDLDELEARLLAGKRLVFAVRRAAALSDRLSRSA